MAIILTLPTLHSLLIAAHICYAFIKLLFSLLWTAFNWKFYDNFADYISFKAMRPSFFGLECAAFKRLFFCGHYARPTLHSLLTTTHICCTIFFIKLLFSLLWITFNWNSVIMAMISLNNSPFWRVISLINWTIFILEFIWGTWFCIDHDLISIKVNIYFFRQFSYLATFKGFEKTKLIDILVKSSSKASMYLMYEISRYFRTGLTD